MEKVLAIGRLDVDPHACADSDAALIAGCKVGERAAFSSLMLRHRGRILNLTYQLLGDHDKAEDAAQETFAQAFRFIGTFREQAQFSTWLYRIAVNCCMARKRRDAELQEVQEFHEPRDAGADAATRAETKIAVDAALAKLPESLRLVLVLRDMQELSYEEISCVLGIPLGTVRSRLHEARRQFRILWSTP
jgi:RNA polymerase sigma-70 factor (ECF subfamily)